MLYDTIKEAKSMYTVKEVADILGVSVHTVRYYDDQGLIPGTKRDSYNQRIFDDMELEWLFVSISLRDTGLPLKEIKRYIELYQQGDSTLQQRFEIMSKQREKTLEEIEKLEQRMHQMVAEDLPLERRLVPLSEAIVYFQQKNYTDKVQLLK